MDELEIAHAAWRALWGNGRAPSLDEMRARCEAIEGGFAYRDCCMPGSADLKPAALIIRQRGGRFDPGGCRRYASLADAERALWENLFRR